MVMILKKGNIPQVPHTEFYHLSGVLSLEEIHGVHGFNGPYTRKYHIRSYSTEQCKPPVKSEISFLLKEPKDDLLQPYHIYSSDIPYEGNFFSSRKPLLFGNNSIVSVSKPVENMSENNFFKNGEKYELYYVQDGEGIVETEYGNLPFRKGLYFIIPKGTIYKIKIKSSNAFFLIIESIFPVVFPPHYMNNQGQGTLMSPVVETEIETPDFQEPIDKKGEYELFVKHSRGNVTCLTLSHHPFDITGWEGTLYPFGFHIDNHHGISREIHTAPPMRQTFQSGDGNTYGFSICSFKPQMEGWNPKDIPAPYAHNNVDSDEVLFFSSSTYEARKGIIKEGSITLHPGSIPHSPHGNSAFRSMKSRAKVSSMLAVMLDTFFEELKITEYAYKFRDKEYPMSWYKASIGET